jgi:hypothetical protein
MIADAYDIYTGFYFRAPSRRQRADLFMPNGKIKQAFSSPQTEATVLPAGRAAVIAADPQGQI